MLKVDHILDEQLKWTVAKGARSFTAFPNSYKIEVKKEGVNPPSLLVNGKSSNLVFGMNIANHIFEVLLGRYRKGKLKILGKI